MQREEIIKYNAFPYPIYKQPYSIIAIRADVSGFKQPFNDEWELTDCSYWR